MRRVFVIATGMVLLLATPAEARWPKLSVPDGQAALTRYLHRDQIDGYNTGFRVIQCHNLSRRTVICKTVEYGVRWSGMTGTFIGWQRARRKGPHLITVYDPFFDYPPY